VLAFWVKYPVGLPRGARPVERYHSCDSSTIPYLMLRSDEPSGGDDQAGPKDE
jgi:hypothetical protein